MIIVYLKYNCAYSSNSALRAGACRGFLRLRGMFKTRWKLERWLMIDERWVLSTEYYVLVLALSVGLGFMTFVYYHHVTNLLQNLIITATARGQMTQIYKFHTFQAISGLILNPEPYVFNTAPLENLNRWKHFGMTSMSFALSYPFSTKVKARYNLKPWVPILLVTFGPEALNLLTEWHRQQKFVL